MDWLTLGASAAASLVGGGVIGGLVSLRVARSESSDRQEALALEREKWEHERDRESRDRSTAVLVEALEWMETLRTALKRYIEAEEDERDPDKVNVDVDVATNALEQIARVLDDYTGVMGRLRWHDFGEMEDAAGKVFDVAVDYVSMVRELPDDAELPRDGELPTDFPFESAYVAALGVLHSELRKR